MQNASSGLHVLVFQEGHFGWHGIVTLLADLPLLPHDLGKAAAPPGTRWGCTRSGLRLHEEDESQYRMPAVGFLSSKLMALLKTIDALCIH